MNISKEERKVLSIWGIIVVIIMLILLLVVKLTGNRVTEEEKNARDNLVYKETNIINDRNLYYTIKNSINKYYSFIKFENIDAIINILDDDYINKNSINKSNIKDKIDFTKSEYDTKNIMCLVSVRNKNVLVVTKGTSNKENVYYLVNLDYNNVSFSITPTNESKYNEVCNESN